MSTEIANSAKSINTDSIPLDGLFVKETLATDILAKNQKLSAKSRSFGPADLWNIRRKKRSVGVKLYNKFL